MTDRNLHYLLLVGHQHAHRRIMGTVCNGRLQPGQPKILDFLTTHQGCTQKEIGEGCVLDISPADGVHPVKYLLDKSSVTGLLLRMEEAGLVRRESCSQDRRVVRIYLTERGMEEARWVQEVFDRVDAIGWGDIPQEEQEQFMKTFRKIISNFENREELT